MPAGRSPRPAAHGEAKAPRPTGLKLRREVTIDCIAIAEAAQLGPGKKSGAEILFRCPNHEDRDPSLSINPSKNLWLCGPCGKSGNYWELAAFLASVDPENKPAVTAWLRERGLLNSNGQQEHHEQQIVATYDYRTAEGDLSYQVVRYEPKDFRQRRPDGTGGWIWDTKGIKRIPYNLPELLKAEYAFVVEGEKDVQSLRKIGLVATCNSGGAGKWTAELSQYFRSDQRITITPDADEPGRKHGEQVAQSLHGRVASVKILELPGPDKDVSDWLQGRDPEAAAEELSRLAEAAPEWKPPAKEDGAATEFRPPAHWQTLDVADVESWQCPDLQWIIEYILARGNLVFVAADTQCGKTLLALYIALKILTGGLLFGKFQIFPIKKILYLLLEDPPRRIKARLLDMRQDMRIKPGQFVVYAAPGLTVNDDFCFAWLKDFIVREGFELVIIDTYQRATPGISSFDDVKQGPILHRLSNLTREINVTLWIHDHYRKEGAGSRRKELDLSSLKGTGGKPQNADCFILMERTGNTIKVLVSSKETDQKPRFLLNVSPKGSKEEKFVYAGDLQQAADDMKAKGQANRNRVFEAIGLKWMSKTEIKLSTGLSSSTVSEHLALLLRDAKIEKIGENRTTRYRRPSEGDDNLFRTVE